MSPGDPGRVFALFLDIEEAARAATDQNALGQVMANATRRLIACRHVIVLARRDGARARVMAASNLDRPDHRAPFVQWLERAARRFAEDRPAGPVDRSELPAEDVDALSDWVPAAVYWQPFLTPDGERLGALWVAGDRPLDDNEALLLARLASTYGHAWWALGRRRRRHRLPRPRRSLLVGALALAIAGLLVLPVRQSVLAPAEVVAARPLVISAPLDGVIRTVAIEPNAVVAAGQLLFSFDATRLAADADLARHELALAQAELDRLRQAAFQDPGAQADVAVQAARVRLAKADLTHAEARLSRVDVRAERGGVAIFSAPEDWVGRPVRVGQRVMTIAAPEAPALRIDLAPDDALALPPGAPVRLFLAVAPMSPVSARMVRQGYAAEPTPEGGLAFRLDAVFDKGARPRIGLRGTARIMGDDVPLAYYLFRRPLSAARRALGF